MKTNNLPWAKIVLIVWLVFSVLYVLGNEYRRLQAFVADRAYKTGLSEAVVQVIQQAQKCEPFPVRFEETAVQLLNVACLQGENGGSEQPAQ